MMGWCPYDGEECRHDGYCDDCEYNKGEEKKMKVYISGPISGNKFYKQDFERAEEDLRSEGYEPVNPAAVYEEGMCMTYKEYIDNDLELLAKCDGIYMLRGWRGSKGARLEHQYAITTGMWIAHQ